VGDKIVPQVILEKTLSPTPARSERLLSTSLLPDQGRGRPCPLGLRDTFLKQLA